MTITAASAPADRQFETIAQMARASAESFGSADAVIDGDVRLTFADVAQGMRAVARGLLAIGVGAGDRVAIWAPNCHAWITAALGVHAAQAWLVPLNTRLKAIEAAHILERADAKVLFTVEGFLGTDYVGALRAVAPHLRALDHVVSLPPPQAQRTTEFDEFLDRGNTIPSERVENSIDAGRSEDVSDVIFTSGTTGAPKGVMLRHGASLHGYQIFADRFGLRNGDRYIVPTPFFHCFGYKAGWMIGLMTGAAVFPVAVFDADTVLELIHRVRITHMPGPPTMFAAMLDHPQRTAFDLTSLRHAMIGAATIPAELVRRVREELGVDAILSAYGLTENHALATLTAPDDPPEVVATTVGSPIPGVEVRIVDDSGADVPTGQPGELILRSPYLMSGYLGDAAATAAAIVDGWLHTGDVGYIDDQRHLRITDRKKDIFIVGGFNVAPMEVEAALRSLDGVAQVAVVGMPDEYFGEVGAAFVVPHHGKQLTPDVVLAYAREHLANFKVPRRVEIVEALPLTATGKVLKTELRDMLRSRRTPPPEGN